MRPRSRQPVHPSTCRCFFPGRSKKRPITYPSSGTFSRQAGQIRTNCPMPGRQYGHPNTCMSRSPLPGKRTDFTRSFGPKLDPQRGQFLGLGPDGSFSHLARREDRRARAIQTDKRAAPSAASKRIAIESAIAIVYTISGDEGMSTFYIVATPIGNLDDITYRAIETLRSTDVIACEDTRRTLKLLSRYEIRKPLISSYAYAEEKGALRILSLLEEGKTVAYVSDAGTPGLSDPGARAVREVVAKGHTVVPIPGPSAFATLVSVAGLVDKAVVFEGFLSPKPGKRRSRLTELMDRRETSVFYESPHRILKFLEDVAAIDPLRPVCIGREMTKVHEEFIRSTAAEALKILQSRADTKGEFSVAISGKKKI